MTRGAVARDVIGFTVAVAAAALLAAAREPAVGMAALIALAAWIAWQDLSDLTIPDGAVAGLAVLALADRFGRGASDGVAALDTALACGLDAALVGGGMWAVREVFYRRRGFDGLGLGDVKLGAAGALLVGAAGFSIALLAASAIGIMLLVTRRGSGTADEPDRLAFGALLAPAVVLLRIAADWPPLAGYVGGPP